MYVKFSETTIRLSRPGLGQIMIDPAVVYPICSVFGCITGVHSDLMLGCARRDRIVCVDMTVCCNHSTLCQPVVCVSTEAYLCRATALCVEFGINKESNCHSESVCCCMYTLHHFPFSERVPFTCSICGLWCKPVGLCETWDDIVRDVAAAEEQQM